MSMGPAQPRLYFRRSLAGAIPLFALGKSHGAHFRSHLPRIATGKADNDGIVIIMSYVLRIRLSTLTDLWLFRLQ